MAAWFTCNNNVNICQKGLKFFFLTIYKWVILSRGIWAWCTLALTVLRWRVRMQGGKGRCKLRGIKTNIVKVGISCRHFNITICSVMDIGIIHTYCRKGTWVIVFMLCVEVLSKATIRSTFFLAAFHWTSKFGW